MSVIPARSPRSIRESSTKPFDLLQAGPERIQEMLGELRGLFHTGALEPLPLRAWTYGARRRRSGS